MFPAASETNTVIPGFVGDDQLLQPRGDKLRCNLIHNNLIYSHFALGLRPNGNAAYVVLPCKKYGDTL